MSARDDFRDELAGFRMALKPIAVVVTAVTPFLASALWLIEWAAARPAGAAAIALLFYLPLGGLFGYAVYRSLPRRLWALAGLVGAIVGAVLALRGSLLAWNILVFTCGAPLARMVVVARRRDADGEPKAGRTAQDAGLCALALMLGLPAGRGLAVLFGGGA